MSGEPAEPEPRTIFLIAFSCELALVFLAALIGVTVGEAAFPFRLELDLKSCGFALVASAPPMALGALMASRTGMRFGPLRRMQERIESILGGAIRTASRGELVLFGFAAGVGEEVLFRGVIQTVSGAHGLWIASAIFAVLHALTPTYCLFAFGISLYLGWVFQATGNLLAPILAHSLLDVVGLLLIHRRLAAEDGIAAPTTRTDGE